MFQCIDVLIFFYVIVLLLCWCLNMWDWFCILYLFMCGVLVFGEFVILEDQDDCEFLCLKLEINLNVVMVWVESLVEKKGCF